MKLKLYQLAFPMDQFLYFSLAHHVRKEIDIVAMKKIVKSAIN